MRFTLYYTVGFLRLYAEVSNLFDTKYTDIGNLVQSGR
jgi:hypothetical protein